MPEPTLEELMKLQEKNEADKAAAQQLQDEKEKADRVAALTKEEARLRTSIEASRKERQQKDATFQEKFQKEQFEKAKAKFFSDYSYTDPEAQKKVLESFTRVNSGSVDSDNVYKDLEAAHLLINRDKYITLERDMNKSAAEAERLKALQSSGGFLGSGSEVRLENVDLDAQDIQAAQWAGIPLEKYKELKSKGKV